MCQVESSNITGKGMFHKYIWRAPNYKMCLRLYHSCLIVAGLYSGFFNQVHSGKSRTEYDRFSLKYIYAALETEVILLKEGKAICL